MFNKYWDDVGMSIRSEVELEILIWELLDMDG